MTPATVNCWALRCQPDVASPDEPFVHGNLVISEEIEGTAEEPTASHAPLWTRPGTNQDHR